MSEILQASPSVKLYEYEISKPSIDDALAHYGVKGMKWGIRKDRKKFSLGKRKKKAKKQKYKDPQQALIAKDLKYVNAHKSEYSTKDINQMLNRIDTEKRLSDMTKQYTTPKAKKAVKKILKSKQFKLVAGIAVGALSIATYRYAHDVLKGAYNPQLKTYLKLIGKRSIPKDAANIGKQAVGQAKNQLIPYLKYFKGV